MSAPEPYWGKHRLDSMPLLRAYQLDARDSSGLTALLTDRAMLGPVGRHADPRDLDAQSIERCTVASLAAVQETQQ